MNLFRLQTFVLVALVSVAFATPASAITRGDPPAEDDLRFDAVAAFSSGHFLGQDPAHPNAQDHNWWCTATLVAPSIAMTATHCVNNTSDEGVHALRFRRHEDGSLGTKQDGPESYHHVWVDHFIEVGGDSLVIILDEPVLHIAPIPMVTEGTANLGGDVPIWNAGWGKEGPGFNEGPRNELLLCSTSTLSSSSSRITFRNAGMSNGCGVNMHDSGSPLLFENELGELRSIGSVSSVMTGVNFARFDGEAGLPFQHNPFDAPDFVIEGETEPGLFAPGDVITVAIRRRNVGEASARRVPLRAQLLGRNGIEQTWYLRGQADTADGDWRNYSLLTDGSLPPGTYSVLVTIDPFNAADEYFETNNSWESPTNLTVTPAPSTTVRITLTPVLYDDMTIASIVTAERDDGTVALVATELNGESLGMSRVHPSPSGTFRFWLSGRRYQVTLGDEVIVQTRANDVTIYPTGTQVPFGAHGHLQGIFTAAPALSTGPGSSLPPAFGPASTLPQDVVGIVTPQGVLYMGSPSGDIGAWADISYETQDFSGSWNSLEGGVSWDPEMDEHRMVGSTANGSFDLVHEALQP